MQNAVLKVCRASGWRTKRRKIHFLTFGGGSRWPDAALRLALQAERTELFETVTRETGDRIFDRWPSLKKYKSFIESNPRGWGYWVWKPLLIQCHMNTVGDGEIIFYLDAGFELLPENHRRLSRLLDNAADVGAMILNLAEQPIFNTVFWTKQDLLDQASSEFRLQNVLRIPQVMAGALAFTKNRANTALIDDWARLSTAEDGHFVDDSPSVAPQKQLFIEHRHDQSVLSLVVQAHGTITCGSALDYDHPRQQVEQRPSLLKMPFLAMRNSRAESDIDDLRQAGIKWSVIDTAMMPSRG